MQAAQFAIMYHTTVTEGVLGLGYLAISPWSLYGENTQYKNLPMLLASQGYIASRTFSLWTNDDRSSGGMLLFGGIDTGKFVGELVTIDQAGF